MTFDFERAKKYANKWFCKYKEYVTLSENKNNICFVIPLEVDEWFCLYINQNNKGYIDHLKDNNMKSCNFDIEQCNKKLVQYFCKHKIIKL